ncbi:MAG TPA: glycosyltransferase [Ktedonobacterales bacterium]
MTSLPLARQPEEGFTCSVGIMAYNEASNIARAIESILAQQLSCATISEVIVVASGCTDNTVPIVTEMAGRDSRIQLVVQERREGKASAINLFLAAARSEVLVMASADVVIKPGSLDALIQPLQDPTVGMVGGRPIPVNDESTFLGFAVHLLWRLHDRIARQAPKLGEVVAFRAIVPSIPRDTPVDEISIQAIITQLKYRLVYEPRAVVYNRGPSTIGDYLRQRRRINSGHLRIHQQQRYDAPTMNVARIGQALLAERPFGSLRAACWTVGTVGLEALARALGAYDHLRRRPHYLWQMAMTTKAQIAGEITAPSYESVLVFHIMDYRQFELELGVRGAQSLAQQVVPMMRRALGTQALVKLERNGAIIALLPVDQDEAERAAAQLIAAIQATPVRVAGHDDPVAARLACGVIAFMQAGGASAKAVLATN